MKLWSAMQRIESLRYQAERLQAHTEWGSSEFRLLMADIARQIDELEAQTQALLEGRAPPPITPLHSAPQERERVEGGNRRAA
jgi:tetrahydromethanopterin S-methyltransferase subunit B